MPTFHKRVENNTIHIQVEVSVAQGQQGHRFMALVDTGATTTAVTSRVVQMLGAPAAIGRSQYGTAGSEIVEANIYGLHVAVPVSTQAGETIFESGRALSVVELPHQPLNYSVLLGMDFLKQFHITMWNSNFIMSN